MNRLFRVRLLKKGGCVLSIEIDLHSLGASDNLPYNIDKYFRSDPGTCLLRLPLLINTRARSDGIANAAHLMRAAYEGRYPVRAAVTVCPFAGNDFLVEDGNSTVLNAIASGWPDILCKIQLSEPTG